MLGWRMQAVVVHGPLCRRHRTSGYGAPRNPCLCTGLPALSILAPAVTGGRKQGAWLPLQPDPMSTLPSCLLGFDLQLRQSSSSILQTWESPPACSSQRQPTNINRYNPATRILVSPQLYGSSPCLPGLHLLQSLTTAGSNPTHSNMSSDSSEKYDVLEKIGMSHDSSPPSSLCYVSVLLMPYHLELLLGALL